jgi:GNAT superfamily N-acetyltransferase
MSENFEIRQAVAADLTSLLGLVKEFAVFERVEGQPKVTADYLAEALFKSPSFCECLVVDSDEGLIGYSIFYPIFRTFSGEKVLYLEDLFIRAPFQGKGLGSRLFKEVYDYGVANGFHRLDFQVLDWNAKAIRFYEKFGAGGVSGNLDFSLQLTHSEDTSK